MVRQSEPSEREIAVAFAKQVLRGHDDASPLSVLARQYLRVANVGEQVCHAMNNPATKALLSVLPISSDKVSF